LGVKFYIPFSHNPSFQLNKNLKISRFLEIALSILM
jgi:hypothetical protein